LSLELIELSGKVNQQMPYHCLAKVQRTLNHAGLPIKGAHIAVLGVAYKPGVGDTRESPALKILTLLKDLGAEIRYHDPHVPTLRDHGLHSVSSTTRSNTPTSRSSSPPTPTSTTSSPPNTHACSSTCAASHARSTSPRPCGCS
jgi:UDP-N-acetyl-D-mannosaminuronate dehydrogenase